MSDYQLASCLKHYKNDQDKVVKPSETVRLAVEKLKKQFDLSSFHLEQRSSVIEGAYSFSSVSDQLTASGKGLTPEQSQASAVMEFAERYSWLHFDYKHYDGYVVKPFNEIKKGSVPTVNESYFFACFPHLTNRAELLEQVKAMPLKWIKGVSLNDHRPFYYPISWYNYTETSNGLATGNAMEEAIVQAICEVIERENVYRFYEERQVARDIDLRSVKHPLAVRALTNARSYGIEFIIKDISFSLGVPTVCVCGTDPQRRGKLSYRGCGYGTHTDPEKALIRALSEYFEGYSLMTNVENEFKLNWGLIISKLPKKNYGFLTYYNAEVLDRPDKPIWLRDMRDLSRDDIRDEILALLKILKKENHDVIFIDKTNPQLGIPVTRIFVPTFRSLIGTSVIDPDDLMSKAYYEAGNKPMAQKYYRQLLLKDYYMNPEVSKVKVEQIYKGDFQEQIQAMGGIKRDVRVLIKQMEQALAKAARRGS
ncbi:MAG: YcaO-like family protein [Candidatus Margulisiibacteriota bacterium]